MVLASLILAMANDEKITIFAKITSDYGTFPLDSTRVWDNPYTGMVRLQIGHYAGQGRVEVYCNNQWGVVCNSESIDYHAATTICTQLGYNDYISFFPVL